MDMSKKSIIENNDVNDLTRTKEWYLSHFRSLNDICMQEHINEKIQIEKKAGKIIP